ncbi:MAG: MoaD/ThiS family protein [Chloroherpetonaceae bacterium]
MTVKVQLFAIGREIVGCSELTLTLGDGATAQTVLDVLKERYPKFQTVKTLMVAIGTDYADLQTELRDGDELAIIPPVSGG